jgi:hypothetical protein
MDAITEIPVRSPAAERMKLHRELEKERDALPNN